MWRWVVLTALALSLAGGTDEGLNERDSVWARQSDSAAKDKPLKLPEWWKPGDPLPIEKTNCVKCHLTAGRELTVPLRDFARSVHDRVHMSCNDCHGGNTKDDTSAHEPEHHFIGTKLSAHMAACAACHVQEAEGFKKGKHYWDLEKSINRKYPACVDCHGNHDVGKPPPDFTLTNVCTDCHKQFAKEMPHAAAIVAENDGLWQVLRKVHAKNNKVDDPTPAAFRKDLKKVRATTSRLIHRTVPITAEEARDLNGRVRRLREGLETWLKDGK
jgi:hypothetical protein